MSPFVNNLTTFNGNYPNYQLFQCNLLLSTVTMKNIVYRLEKAFIVSDLSYLFAQIWVLKYKNILDFAFKSLICLYLEKFHQKM